MGGRRRSESEGEKKSMEKEKRERERERESEREMEKGESGKREREVYHAGNDHDEYSQNLQERSHHSSTSAMSDVLRSLRKMKKRETCKSRAV